MITKKIGKTRGMFSAFGVCFSLLFVFLLSSDLVVSATVCTDIPVITQKGVLPGTTTVILSLTGFSLPDGTVLPAQIYEKDGSSNDSIRSLSATIDAAGNANVVWTITQADLDKTPGDYEEFYFTAGGMTSGYLKLIDLTQVHWEDRYSVAIGNGTSNPNTTVSTSGLTRLRMVSEDPRIAEGTNVTFQIFEKDTWPNADDSIKTVYATYAAGQVIGLWEVDTADVDTKTEDYDRFYFIATGGGIQTTSNIVELIKRDVDLTECEEDQVTICEQYTTEEICEFNDCSVTSFGNIDDCGDKTGDVPGVVGCYYEIECGCGWNSTTDSCGPISEEVMKGTCDDATDYSGSLGFCSIVQAGGADTCDDGFLNYRWTAIWDWKENVYDTESQVPTGEFPAVQTIDGKWHYYSVLRDSCTSGEKVIPCPTSIALPFFDGLELVATLAIITLIYYFVFLFRKKAKRKEKSIVKNKK